MEYFLISLLKTFWFLPIVLSSLKRSDLHKFKPESDILINAYSTVFKHLQTEMLSGSYQLMPKLEFLRQCIPQTWDKKKPKQNLKNPWRSADIFKISDQHSISDLYTTFQETSSRAEVSHATLQKQFTLEKFVSNNIDDTRS